LVQKSIRMRTLHKKLLAALRLFSSGAKVILFPYPQSYANESQRPAFKQLPSTACWPHSVEEASHDARINMRSWNTGYIQSHSYLNNIPRGGILPTTTTKMYDWYCIPLNFHETFRIK
jgi:hypothetical protein